MTRTQFTLFAAVVAVAWLCAQPAAAQIWGRDGSHIILVAKKGGDFDSVQAALDSIFDASEENRYLVYVAPGVYHERVEMKPYVDIEGAGRLVTKITYPGGQATLVASRDTELHSLTIESVCDGADWCNAEGILIDRGAPVVSGVAVKAEGRDFSRGVTVCCGAAPLLRDLRVEVEGDCDSIGVDQIYHAAATLEQVEVAVSADPSCTVIGVRNSNSDLRLSRSSVAAETAILNIYGTAALTEVSAVGRAVGMRHHDPVDSTRSLTISHSRIEGGELALVTTVRDAARVTHSQIVGAVEAPYGSRSRCFATCDADLNELSEDCRPIPR